MDALGEENPEFPRSRESSLVECLRPRDAGGVFHRGVVRHRRSAAPAYFRSASEFDITIPALSRRSILAPRRLLRNAGTATQAVLPFLKANEQGERSDPQNHKK